MTENVTLYLHIGTGKTGTSSIQNFMAGNIRTLWNSCSCLYPNMKEKQPLNGNFINHLYLFNSCNKDEIIPKIRRAVIFCKKNSNDKLVLSAESLFESADGPGLAKKIAAVPDVNLRIIVYLRRQDYWLESAWKQWGYKMPDNRNISDYILRRDCNWYTRLQEWEKAVGKDRIIVRAYEKQQLPDGLIPDFLNVIGIDYNAHQWIAQKDLFKGFQRDVMEILFLNKDFCRGITDNRLQDFFERNLDESYQKESFKSYSFLSPAERIGILSKYQASNQDVAREYLNREDGRLFYEPWPAEDEPWEPYTGLTVETIVPIFTQILFNIERYQLQHQRNEKQREKKGKAGIIGRVQGYLHRKMDTGTTKR